MVLYLQITCIHSVPAEIAFGLKKGGRGEEQDKQINKSLSQSFSFQLPVGVQGCGSHISVLVLYLESHTYDLSQGSRD